MTDERHAELFAITWALVYGLLLLPVVLAIVWSAQPGTAARKARWPAAGVVVLYLIALFVLLRSARA
jgi:hypothetical protein